MALKTLRHSVRKFQLYKVKSDPTKGLVVEQDQQGWYYIAKLARTKDNIFASIKEIELVVGVELEFVEEEYISEDSDE